MKRQLHTMTGDCVQSSPVTIAIIIAQLAVSLSGDNLDVLHATCHHDTLLCQCCWATLCPLPPGLPPALPWQVA